jgi:DNA-binding NarL/FixJ family response regulator
MWTAFILYSHSLFARGLETLLQGQNGVIVTGVEQKGDEAFAHIRVLKPDVIIVEAEPTGFEPEKLLSRFLREQPRARMVRLNLEDNTAILYSGSRCTANSVEDLIQCVLSSLMTQH